MKAHCASVQVPRGKSAINQVLNKQEVLDFDHLMELLGKV